MGRVQTGQGRLALYPQRLAEQMTPSTNGDLRSIVQHDVGDLRIDQGAVDLTPNYQVGKVAHGVRECSLYIVDGNRKLFAELLTSDAKRFATRGVPQVREDINAEAVRV